MTPPPPFLGLHEPPHVREKSSLLRSMLIATIVTVVFYFALNYYQVPTAGAVPAAVALWVGLVTILSKLVMKHP